MKKMLYTISEAAEMLGISRTTLTKMRKEGALTCVMLRGRIMVTPAEIERLVADLPEAPMGGRFDASVVRQWAKENGYEVGTRGRLHQDLFTAYAAANP